MSHNKTRQLARALRLNRSTSFSSYVPANNNLSFSHHFAQTASLRPSSPSSSTSSTYSSSKSSSKDYGYSSGQSQQYQTNHSYSSSPYLDVKTQQRGLQRHSSFNPSDYRPKYSVNDSPKYSVNNPPRYSVNELSSTSYKNQNQSSVYSANNQSSAYSANNQSKSLLETNQRQNSILNRRSMFTKCRRSSSLMSRYKPKSLRFADDTPCILSIYVAEPQKQPKLVYQKENEIVEQEKHEVKGILKKNEEECVEFYANDYESDEEESVSDDSYKPPVIPRTLPPATLPKSTDHSQNGSMTNLKGATFGSTADSHYKALYEKSLEENEKLRKQIDDLKYGRPKEPVDPQLNGSNVFVTVRKTYNGTLNPGSTGSHSPSPTATQSTGNSTHMEDLDRRAYERKISELEYELQKARQLQSDHKRLKDENNALIRVISKLSKDTGAQTKTATATVSK